MQVDRTILALVSQYWRDDYVMAAKRQRQWASGLRLVDLIAYAMVCSLLLGLASAVGSNFLVKFLLICFTIVTIHLIGSFAVSLWRCHRSVILKSGAFIGSIFGIAQAWDGTAASMLASGLWAALIGAALTAISILLAAVFSLVVESTTRIGAPIAYPIKFLIEKTLRRRITIANRSRVWVAGGIPGQFAQNAGLATSIFTDDKIHRNNHQWPFRRHRNRDGYAKKRGDAIGLSGLATTPDEGFAIDEMGIGSPYLIVEGSSFDADSPISSGAFLIACDVPSMAGINPSTGLPMLDDIPSGVDVGGNLWGDSDSCGHCWSDTNMSFGFDDGHFHSDLHEMSHDLFEGGESISFDET